MAPKIVLMVELMTAAGIVLLGGSGRAAQSPPKPNIIHLVSDELGYYDQVHAHSYYPAYIVRNSAELPLAGNQGGRSGQTYSHYVIVAEAMKFIRANKDRPFYCYLPVTPPHGWFDIPDTDPAWARFKDKDWPAEAKRYAAMVHMVDRQVGELVIDLGAEHTVRGFRYLARQDNGWNGAIKDCESFVSHAPDQFDQPIAKATLQKTRKAQEVNCEPVQGRYVMLRALSEVNGGPWASAAELGVIGK